MLAVIVLLVVACKDKPKQEEAKPAVETTGSGSAPGSVSGSPPQADAAVAAARDERCDDPCRFLAETPLSDIAAKVQASCSSEWPAASGKDCSQLDYQRNCIYATAGYTFKKKRYQAAFGGEPWYKARADFKDTDLSAVATANVAALKKQAADCRKGSTIDVKDKQIVDAWLAKLRAGKPEVPAIVFDGSTFEGTTSVDEMKQRLIAGKASFAAKKLRSMSYQDRSSLRQQWVKPLEGKTVRIVELDFSDTGGACEGDEECGYGLWLVLAIDNKDQVIALEEGSAACPFAYLVTERGLVLQGELLRNRVGREREATQSLAVTAACGGRLTFRIAEDKPEVTYLDELVLVVDGEVIEPTACGALCTNDGRVHVLRPGEHVEVSFDTPATCARIELRANGHYTPIQQ
jgi:hypothetical protein